MRRTSRQFPGCWSMNLSGDPVFSTGTAMWGCFWQKVWGFGQKIAGFLPEARSAWDSGTQWHWSCVLPCPICDGNEVGFGNVLCQGASVVPLMDPCYFAGAAFSIIGTCHLSFHDDIMRMPMLLWAQNWEGKGCYHHVWLFGSFQGCMYSTFDVLQNVNVLAVEFYWGGNGSCLY